MVATACGWLGEGHQVGPGVGLELVPQLVGAKQQRYVGGVLEVGLPDDPRPAVAGPLVVRRTEALQAEHPLPASGQVRGRRAAHAAQPDDDDVVGHPVTVARRYRSGDQRGRGR